MTRLLRRADFQMLAIVLALCLLGAVAIYSCTKGELARDGKPQTARLDLQLGWIALGLLMLFATMLVDVGKLPRLSWPIYLTSVGLLLLVLVVGALVRGTQRWIPLGPLNLQPAELAKLAVIVMLGSVLAHSEERAWDFVFVAKTLVYVGGPALLILMQPDLGTPIVLFLVWLVMLFAFGANPMHLLAITLAGVLLFSGAWGFGLIRPHQKARMVAFLNPEEDPQGASYHLNQSLIAVGSGHLWGQGLFQGSQSQGAFIPDQETDFVFTVIGEEMGFVGSVGVVLLYGLLVFRGLVVAGVAPSIFTRTVAAGITGMFLVEVFTNIGMTIGLAPVKGMALPFLSYGGSSLITNMIAIGMLQSIYMRRNPIVF